MRYQGKQIKLPLNPTDTQKAFNFLLTWEVKSNYETSDIASSVRDVLDTYSDSAGFDIKKVDVPRIIEGYKWFLKGKDPLVIMYYLTSSKWLSFPFK